jgi:glycosyltransferase involved in cell wall biosynthesis
VKFFGQRSDVAELLAAADIFCQPSLQPEPFGLVFIEALWAGLPVVTTRMGGAVEIVDESCGMLAEPGNVASLAEGLERLIKSPELRARLGRSAAPRAQQISDPETQMRKLRDALPIEQRKAG